MTMTSPFDSFGGKLPFAGESDTVGKASTVPQSIAQKPAPAPAPKKVGVMCYESHPILELGGGIFIGGSCSRPMVANAGLYIGFELGMAVMPFAPGKAPPRYVSYHILDRQAPKDAASFKALVTMVASFLKAGGVVHAGCIGGHGRTGTFLSALVTEITGNLDSIQWVRDNYCHKAVETDVQVDFLHEHYGITKREGSKGHYAPSNYDGYQSSYPAKSSKGKGKKYASNQDLFPSAPAPYPGSRERSWDPVPSNKNIFKSGLI